MRPTAKELCLNDRMSEDSDRSQRKTSTIANQKTGGTRGDAVPDQFTMSIKRYVRREGVPKQNKTSAPGTMCFEPASPRCKNETSFKNETKTPSAATSNKEIGGQSPKRFSTFRYIHNINKKQQTQKLSYTKRQGRAQ